MMYAHECHPNKSTPGPTPSFPRSVAFYTFTIYWKYNRQVFFGRLRVNLVAKEDADDVEAVEAAKVNGNENGNEVRQKSPRKDVALCSSLVLQKLKN